jgi:lipopolysaccharide/colanic/teichoic acid biosynthesis glycosyltransferase
MFSQHPYSLPQYTLSACPALPGWKRALDIACCVAMLPLLGAVTFFVAVSTALTAQGPILFRQEYVGFLGRRFAVYRFRTMRVLGRGHGTTGGSEAGAPRRALIPGGEFLRASGLADLPQIVNVLRGEMSIVGPRAKCPTRLSGRESDLIALPGLTGVWRFVDESVPTPMVSWEQTYPEKKSLWADLKIILRTIPAVLGLRSRR